MTVFVPTQADITTGGATIMAFLSEFFNTVAVTYMRSDHPGRASGDAWTYSTPDIAIPVSTDAGGAFNSSRGVAVVPSSSAVFIYVTRGRSVLELIIDQLYLDPSIYPQTLLTYAVIPPEPEWNPITCPFAQNVDGSEVVALFFDAPSNRLIVVYTYPDATSASGSLTGMAAIKMGDKLPIQNAATGLNNVSQNAFGFDGVSVGVLDWEVQGLPYWASAQGTERQKRSGYYCYITVGSVTGGYEYCFVNCADGSFELPITDGIDEIISLNYPDTRHDDTGAVPSNYVILDPDTYTVFSARGNDQNYNYGPTRFQFGGVDVGKTVPLSDFLHYIALQSGYDTSQITITGLDDTLIYGAALTESTELETLLNGISKVYAFDYYNGGDYLRIKKRDENPDTVEIAATYDVSSLLPIQADRTVTTKRLPPSQVATAVAIEYFDYGADFQRMTQRHSRNQFPVKTADKNKAELSISVPIVMDATDAAQAALRAVFQASAENITNEFMTAWVGIPHEPTDVIQLLLGKFAYLVKLNEVTVNGDLSVSMAGTNFLAKLNVDLELMPTAKPPVSSTGLQRSRVAIIDAPSLVAGDQSPFCKALVVVVPLNGGVAWPGADIYVSLNAEPFELIRSPTKAPPYMVVNNGPTNSVPWTTDRENVLRVTSYGVVPLSCTEDQARGGTNYALWGDTGRWEFIAFADVEDKGNGAYNISTLIRGMNGTEMYVNTHQPNDLLLLLNVTVSDAISYPFDAVGETLTVIASNVGAETRADTDQATVTLTGASAKPFAPQRATLTVTEAGAVLAWLRRDRAPDLDPDDGSDEAPLSEVAEAYETDIVGSTGEVVRTLLSSVPSVTYTEEMQTADSVDATAGLSVAIYQMSANVGRGFPYTRVLFDGQ